MWVGGLPIDLKWGAGIVHGRAFISSGKLGLGKPAPPPPPPPPPSPHPWYYKNEHIDSCIEYIRCNKLKNIKNMNDEKRKK